eukprot:scaffold50184_cov112-Phaeocystis_antarctica.AAC.2
MPNGPISHDGGPPKVSIRLPFPVFPCVTPWPSGSIVRYTSALHPSASSRLRIAATTIGPGVCAPPSLSSGCSVMFISPALITVALAHGAPICLPFSVFATCLAMAATMPTRTSVRNLAWSASWPIYYRESHRHSLSVVLRIYHPVPWFGRYRGPRHNDCACPFLRVSASTVSRPHPVAERVQPCLQGRRLSWLEIALAEAVHIVTSSL